jgi:hypothetical protein
VARQAAEDLARRGMGTTLTAMLCSGGRAAVAHIGDSRAFRLRGGQLRQITNDHTIRNLVIDEGLLAPTLPLHLDGRPDRSADMEPRDLRAGDRYLQYIGRLSPVVDDRPQRNVLISAPYPPRRRPAGRPSRRPSQRFPADSVSLAKGLHAGQVGSRLALPTEDARPQISRDTGSAIRPAARPPPPSCPMCPGVLAYHRRDNVPGQTQAKIRPPGPSAKITQGARPLRQEPVHAT